MKVSKGEEDVWSVYIIRCGDSSLYTGISNDVAKRFTNHVSRHPTSAKYLRSRHPLELEFSKEIGSKSLATRVELQIKRLPKHKKEALVAGSYSLEKLIHIHKDVS